MEGVSAWKYEELERRIPVTAFLATPLFVQQWWELHRKHQLFVSPSSSSKDCTPEEVTSETLRLSAACSISSRGDKDSRSRHTASSSSGEGFVFRRGAFSSRGFPSSSMWSSMYVLDSAPPPLWAVCRGHTWTSPVLWMKFCSCRCCCSCCCWRKLLWSKMLSWRFVWDSSKFWPR